ncbi:MAG: nylA 2, partial [Solirubrobacterales bacterium]|nr:nylA 2 [Solirubrobacterales bacterium]
GPPGGFAAAAAAGPGRLRIAVSLKPPPGTVTKLGADQRRAIEDTASLLRSLGHEVVEREVDYGPAAFLNTVTRYFRGIRDDAAAMTHPERLERRTRGMARLGGLVGDGALAKARAGEAAVAARVNAIFDHADVVLMPGPAGGPFRVGRLQGRSALWSINASAAKVPWYGVWNAIGQPAASVPAGFDAAGLPLAVQLAGPRDGEATLLALSAQLEAARPWTDRRPPV